MNRICTNNTVLKSVFLEFIFRWPSGPIWILLSQEYLSNFTENVSLFPVFVIGVSFSWLSPESQPHPGLHQRKCDQQDMREGVLPLLCPGEAPPGVPCPALGSPAQKGHRPIGASPEEGHQVHHLSHEEQLRQWGFFSLEKIRLSFSTFQYLQGGCKKAGE